MSLRTKLILVLLLVLVIPAVLSQWLLVSNFNEEYAQNQREHLQTVLDNAATVLEETRKTAAFNALLIARSGELERYRHHTRYRLPELAGYRALLKSFATHVQQHPEYSEILLADRTGLADVRFSLQAPMTGSHPVEDLPRFLQGVNQGQAAFHWISRQRGDRLTLFVAQGVETAERGVIDRHRQAHHDAWILIRIDLSDLGHGHAPATADRVHLHVRSDEGPLWQSAPWPATVDPARFLLLSRPLETGVVLEGLLARRHLNPLDPVLLKSAAFLLFQFCVVVAFLFFILHRWLVQPLQHALELTRQLGRGEWLGEMRLPRQDELGQLVQGLHAMSQQLQAMTAELEQKRAQAEQAERLKTEFFANISHEIRTPVNIIVGVMKRLERYVTEPRQQDYLRSATQEAHNLVHLIDELILLADLETHRNEWVAVEFYVPDLVQHGIAPALPQAFAKHLQFDAHIDDQLNTVLVGDSQKLGKLLEILLDNAIKFTAQGSVTLNVRVTQWHPDHVDCEFSVRDTGCGIAPDLIARLGQAFAPQDNALHRQPGNLGLGLTIARGYLHLMGSVLLIDSTPGVGSEFRFVVRLARAGHG